MAAGMENFRIMGKSFPWEKLFSGMVCSSLSVISFLSKYPKNPDNPGVYSDRLSIIFSMTLKKTSKSSSEMPLTKVSSRAVRSSTTCCR